jgi:hypothetical protein
MGPGDVRNRSIRQRRVPAPGLAPWTLRSALLPALTALSALLLWPLLSGCSETSAPVPGPRIELVTSATFLMRGDSAEVRATLVCDGEDPPAGLAFAWSASCGRITGDGDHATFVAPETADTARIRVVVTAAGADRHAGELRLPVYRQIVILKADDFVYASGRATGIAPGWQLYLDYICSRRLATSVGVIGQRVDAGPAEFFVRLATLAQTHRVEFFNHGWTHAIGFVDDRGQLCSEFKNRPYEEQRDHLLATQSLMRERAGIVLRGFGAPGNAIDASTLRLIDGTDDIAYWLYGNPSSRKRVLSRVADIEDSHNLPDYATFLATYKPDAECIVYQIHPWFWTDALLAEFAKCVDDLVAAGVTFMLPGEYCALTAVPVGADQTAGVEDAAASRFALRRVP